MFDHPLYGAPCSPQNSSLCEPGLGCFDGRCGICKDGSTSMPSRDRLMQERCIDGRYVVTQWEIGLQAPRTTATAVAATLAVILIGIQFGWCYQVYMCARRARHAALHIRARQSMNLSAVQRLSAALRREGKMEVNSSPDNSATDSQEDESGSSSSSGMVARDLRRRRRRSSSSY